MKKLKTYLNGRYSPHAVRRGISFLTRFCLTYLVNTALAMVSAWVISGGASILEAISPTLLTIFIVSNTVVSALFASMDTANKLFTLVDDVVDLMLGMGRSSWGYRGQLDALVSQVKYQMTQKNHKKALHIVNQIIERDSSHAEAFYLKGVILLKGFEKPSDARRNLEEVTQLVPDKSHHLNLWSKNLLDQIPENRLPERR